MAGGDKLSIGTVQPMPKIFGVNGEEMTPSDLKQSDILVVFWAGSAKSKYKAGISVVRFGGWGENRLIGKGWIFFVRAESEPLSECCYPLKDISEIRFCARDSSASSQIFLELCELYKENRRLTGKLERIKERFMNFLA